MKGIHDFSRGPAARNYTVAHLRALKGSGRKLGKPTPKNATEIRACLDDGIDLLVVRAEQIDEAREVAVKNCPCPETNISIYPHEREKFLQALD